MKFFISILCLSVLLTGCLKTRADLRGEGQDPDLQRQTVAQQVTEKHTPAPRVQSPAPVQRPQSASSATVRFEEYDEQMRTFNGRLEVIENSINQNGAAIQADRDANAKDRQTIEQKFTAYEDALKKLEAEVVAQNEEITRLKTAGAPVVTAPAASNSKSAHSAFEQAEELFSAKKFKEAIVAYQKYRDANPKGKLYSEATYKIGVCFQELKLRDEAKAFFLEVTAKFPHSKQAKKANVRMKTLK